MPAVETAERTGTSTQARCEFDRSTTLVALPTRILSLQELAAVGLSEDAAATLDVSKTFGNRWCSLDRREPQGPAAKAGWESRCVRSTIEIDRPIVVTARSVTIAVAPSPSGVKLLQVRAGG